MSKSSDPFAPPRRANSMKLAPPPLPPPPPVPSTSLTSLSDAAPNMRQQIYRYETMYKQTKNQLEILKTQFRGQEKELHTFKTQKQVIEQNHGNIVHWQKKIANLEMENETLMDKNGLFLQQKNTFLLQLTDIQEQCEEYRMQLRQKCEEYQRLENEYTNSTQNYTQRLSKKEEKYKNLKQEYLALNSEFKQKNCEHQSMKQEMNMLQAQLKDVSEQNLLNKDKFEKLHVQHQNLQSQQQQLQTQISHVNEDSVIAVQLASKKDKSIIKDLRAAMKAETIKCQQWKAENALLKDELNDLRDWRENYLRQQTLQNMQQSSPLATTTNNGEDPEFADNVSTTSSASNQTASSKTSRDKDSRNHVTYKEKMKIMRKKSVTAIHNARSNIPVPSLSNLISNELGHVGASDALGTPLSAVNGNTASVTMSTASSSPPPPPPPTSTGAEMTKEHDEVIEALSNRLAIVKENYANLKTVITSKDDDIGKLHFELEKKKELIADLIEKLVDKPLPPTPTQILEEETLTTQRIRVPPSMPPPAPKVIVSPSYNKGIGHSAFAIPGTAATHMRHTADNDQDDAKTPANVDAMNGDGI